MVRGRKAQGQAEPVDEADFDWQNKSVNKQTQPAAIKNNNTRQPSVPIGSIDFQARLGRGGEAGVGRAEPHNAYCSRGLAPSVVQGELAPSSGPHAP